MIEQLKDDAGRSTQARKSEKGYIETGQNRKMRGHLYDCPNISFFSHMCEVDVQVCFFKHHKWQFHF